MKFVGRIFSSCTTKRYNITNSSVFKENSLKTELFFVIIRGIFVCRKIASRFGTGNPSPTEKFAQNVGFATGGYRIRPYGIQAFVRNLRNKNNYALRITHYALNSCSGKLTVIEVPTFSSLSSFISAPW